jgi:hypothetical protein
MFMKSKRHSSFKEDWDWAPTDHEIKERPGRQKRKTVRGHPLVFTDSETRKVG